MSAVRDLTVGALDAGDANRGVLRLDPADMALLGASTGEVLAITGSRTAHARALPARAPDRDRGLVLLDAATRANAGTTPGTTVRVTRLGQPPRAQRLSLAQESGTPLPRPVLQRALAGRPLAAGDGVRIALAGGREATLRVTTTDPAEPVLVDETTTLALQRAAQPRAETVRYEDVGGLGRAIERVREVVELPLTHGALFDHLGIAPPKGVLLVGPPGTGKTLIARAIAGETGAHFTAINGPEIVDRYYGASEQALRQAFETARKNAPAIIFIDELDAIAPKRDGLGGDRQVERRIVAQLLTLMDGLSGRGEVMVLAATNLPDSIDPALRRPGRFDREIRIDPPDRIGRQEILAVHSRAMPLGPDVDVAQLAESTPGFVGADLAAFCREAALAALRRLGALDAKVAPDTKDMFVTAADFAAARALVSPSALREAAVEIPAVRFSAVAGLDALRATIERTVLAPLATPERFARFGVSAPRGVLLAGPPGTGKTLLARAIATEAGVGFVAVRGPELLSHFQGASEKALRDVFARARTARPCIVFFDEMDAIAGRRGGGDGATLDRMVAQLLTEMDGITPADGLIVLGATNRTEAMDPALLRPGRFDLVLRMPELDRAARLAVLRVHAAHMPLSDPAALATLADATEGAVGADLAALCRLAALSALARDADAVTTTDFDRALATFRETRPCPTM
jgi:transitional endoplasmic reticulum ATPase